jgi:hypothetical protein
VVAGADADEVAVCACTEIPVASVTLAIAIANAHLSTLTNGADLDEALHRMPALFNQQRF